MADAPHPYAASFSALDAYHGLPEAPVLFGIHQGSLIDIAKAYDRVEYPGLSYADASVELSDGRHLRLRTLDALSELPEPDFPPLGLLYDRESRIFHDPRGVYAELRSKETRPRMRDNENRLFEAAILVSRYPYELPRDFAPETPRLFPLEAQRDLLALILTGPRPERGLRLLKESGFLARYWPELEVLAGVDHAKEFHPEGDVWEHTLETFRYRKLPDFRLSLALLLHDSGKPQAKAADGRRFDRHAELGRGLSERFLRKLGFREDLISDVSFLIRYHMLPAALPRLPVDRGKGALEDPRFPLLLELYKCDELSCFKGPEAYYEACAAYRSYLKNVRNPYRDAEGRKLARIYLEG